MTAILTIAGVIVSVYLILAYVVDLSTPNEIDLMKRRR